jgi:hypothetical protein
MPAMKPGGHAQGNKVTLVTTVTPTQRRKVEEEAAELKTNLSDVMRKILADVYSVPEDE